MCIYVCSTGEASLGFSFFLILQVTQRDGAGEEVEGEEEEDEVEEEEEEDDDNDAEDDGGDNADVDAEESESAEQCQSAVALPVKGVAFTAPRTMVLKKYLAMPAASLSLSISYTTLYI